MCVDATYDRGGDGWGRLINHSHTRANLKTIKVTGPSGEPRLLFVTTMEVGKHEELMFDYGDRENVEAFPWLRE
jgi:hypothetical protein